MAYSLSGDKVQLVTINARINGQMIINRLWYAYTGSLPNPDADVSSFFLTFFRTQYRAQILASYYSPYTVFAYEMKELNTVTLVSAGPPSRFKPTFDVDKVDQLLGAGADIGALAPGAFPLLPANVAMRMKMNPTSRALGFFKGNYLRLSFGAPDTLLSVATQEKWDAGALATYTAAWGGFIATAMHGVAVPAGAGWFPLCYSINYYGRVVKPIGGAVRDGGKQVTTAVPNAYVGTQTTRRWTPQGTFRGR